MVRVELRPEVVESAPTTCRGTDQKDKGKKEGGVGGGGCDRVMLTVPLGNLESSLEQ